MVAKLDWQKLCVLARDLRGIEMDIGRMIVDGQPFVRLVDPKTVAFMIAGNAERDALIARAPSTYFINERFAQMPVVLAQLEELDTDDARERLVVAWKQVVPEDQWRGPADAKAPKPEGPSLYCLAYITNVPKPERRKFKRIGHGTVAEWMWKGWRAFIAGKSWGHAVPEQQATSIERHFQRAIDDEVPCPKKLDDKALALLDQRFECKPHMFHDGGDDDEGLEWEIYIFDDEYFAEEDSDYLPHPDRGDTKKHTDDPYRQLLAKHKKHQRTTR